MSDTLHYLHIPTHHCAKQDIFIDLHLYLINLIFFYEAESVKQLSKKERRSEILPCL